MIYTVTFNPSLDYVVRVTDFELGSLHRSEAEELTVGGKGINVTAVLRLLGVESTAFGFVAGFTGREIMERLDQMGISSDFIQVKQGFSRINIKLKSKDFTETEVNGQGPRVHADELNQLYDKLSAMQEGDFLVLSGSVPSHIPDRDYSYAHICDSLNKKKINFVVDAEGDLLRNTLGYQPFLIKPNLQELGRLFGRKLADEQSIIDCARSLQKKGAQNVLISLAGDGAILIDHKGRTIRQSAPSGKAINSVGAGDTMVAGFLAGVIGEKVGRGSTREERYDNALRYSVACGSAAAFSKGMPDVQQIEEIYQKLLQSR